MGFKYWGQLRALAFTAVVHWQDRLGKKEQCHVTYDRNNFLLQQTEVSHFQEEMTEDA
jgi:hypothetical protein